LKIDGKTGPRYVATMPRGYSLYQDIVDGDSDLTDPQAFVFMPEYPNRTTAVNTARGIFNHFLDVTELKTDNDGNDRLPYSLRHYALQSRLRKSNGKINIYASNSG